MNDCVLVFETGREMGHLTVCHIRRSYKDRVELSAVLLLKKTAYSSSLRTVRDGRPSHGSLTHLSSHCIVVDVGKGSGVDLQLPLWALRWHLRHKGSCFLAIAIM